MPPENPSLRRRPRMGVATIRLIASYDGTGLPSIEQRVATTVSALTGARWPRTPGELTGSGPWLLWRNPTERLAIADERSALQPLLDALAPCTRDDGCAIDLSESLVIRELDAADLNRLAPRLTDPMSMPGVPGGTRLRWADVPVVLVRLPGDRVLLMADAALDDYLAAWWQYAADAARHDAAGACGPTATLIDERPGRLMDNAFR